ncbi:hypothetical protein TCAL_13127 [Tigriopus californicus]|uniref:Mitochondrial carrier protein n=1 Tax=Tigriopus californicus TaxID=6832 RepID=A0A553NNV8_TIGCA|nr:mitochondrial carnitine/acylcarnitine carrier protein-like [Tigriopus californicus]TRY67122.1 hypothetical protein TCAL_13127 [Tigriopus californicus]|eukprot:TCALIF_13127-PA protein Name:"Similar to Slc25a20 Mitochondrial carnitine/acylcarnitine carrier protein (Mus musculus)" AED:0.01 eAED:0.01 QI:0/-1/0/1/-1/1/1/0/302
MSHLSDLAKLKAQIRSNPNLNVFSGAVGGLASLTIGHPLDTVKVTLQTMKADSSGKMPYAGMLDCSKKLIKSDGILSLYRGLGSMIIMTMPRFALTFHGNALGKQLYAKWFPRDEKKTGVPVGQILFGGTFSQILVSPFIVAPFERVKVLMQTQKPREFKNQWDCFKFLLNKQGLASVFRGIPITYSRDMPTFGFYFLCYELVKYAFDKEGSNPLVTLLAGGCAGVGGWAVAIPMDTIKNRHQATMKKYNSFVTLKHLIKEEGFTGLFRGGGTILIRAFPTNAAAFLGYETCVSLIARFTAI